MSSGTIRIAGVNLAPNKQIWIALTSLYGIGRTRAMSICNVVGADPQTKVQNLSSEMEELIRTEVAKYEVEGDLRRKISMSIKRLIDLKCFRGLRHVKGLPTRGQRTRTNAKTRKGKKSKK